MTFQLRHSLVLLLPLLAACGGGGESDAFRAAADRADAKEAQARSLALDSPCSSTAQCGHLVLQKYQGCADPVYKPYSLVSPSAAAASAAAAEQRELAAQAARLAPPSDTVCIAMVPRPPTLICQASTCQALAQ